MAKDPAFLFYPSAFLTGTMFMSDDQVGKYIRLLCAQHQHGHLNPEQMQRLCHGIADAEILSKFKVDKKGNYFNERLEIEIEKRAEHSNKQRDKANKRWQCRGNAAAMPLENTNKDKNINTSKDKREDKGVTGEKETRISKIQWANDHPIKSYVLSNFPILCRLSEPTYQQCEDVLANRTKQQIAEVIEAMANYRGIEKKYASFISTLRNWLKRRDESQKNTNNQQITENGKIAYPFETKREYEERTANEKLKRSQEKLRNAYRQRIDEGATADDLGISQEEWRSLRHEFGYTSD